MTLRLDLFIVLIALGVAAYACRAGGFWLMRFVPITPRLQSALRAAPLAVMIGIVAPAALHGHLPEAVGLAVTLIVMRWLGQDLLAAVAGVVSVALLRAM